MIEIRQIPVDQNVMKQRAAEAAVKLIPDNATIGVGSGSTVNCFIDALASVRHKIKGAVASSVASETRLKAAGIPVLSLDEAELPLVFTVDGADEINPAGEMIKGGGGALTREKIVAAASKAFICIADESKCVDTLGAFALPVEVIPMAAGVLTGKIESLTGSKPVLRLKDGKPYVTDNGNHILDVPDLTITDPKGLESALNALAGVVTCGLFAISGAKKALIARADGTVQTKEFAS